MDHAGGGHNTIDRLRSIVQDCLGKHMYSSAIFFADKLVTMSEGAPADVYLLAQAHYVSKQYRRALLLLRGEHLLNADARFRYLAAKCLFECSEFDECLATLGDTDDEDMQITLSTGGKEISVHSATCLLRGRVYDALENRPRAVFWYKEALKADPFCYEAFEALIDNHMLTTEEEAALLADLRLGGEDEWLALLYSCKTKKYDQGGGTFEAKIAALEAAPGAGAAGAGAAGAGAGPGGEEGEGWGLAGNGDVVSCQAEWCYHRGDFQASYDTTKALLDRDPYQLTCLPVHLAAAVELRKKNDLFLLSHRLVEEYPTRAIAWFAVGCYYLCIRHYDSARRYFSKATTLESTFAPAWLGFGNAFTAQDESDQAMAAYRTAARLFAGCHLPLLCIGMEYQRTNNLHLAGQFCEQARALCPTDPLVFNELGVLAYRNRDFAAATRHLSRALELVPEPVPDMWEPTVVNMAHALRKQGLYEEAVQWYEKALALCPHAASTYAALGFTYHLGGDLPLAIEFYHKALGLRPEDTFAGEMLSTALAEECARCQEEHEGVF